MSDAELTRCKAILLGYVRTHGSVPPYSRLADLWGLRSKSAVHWRVQAMIAQGVLTKSPDNRLILTAMSSIAKQVPNESVVTDPVTRAVAGWTQDHPVGMIPAYEVMARILSLARIIDRASRQLVAQEGLSLGEVYVLDALDRLGSSEGVTPGQLISLLLVSPSGITERVNNLVALQLVERIPDDSDRRRKRIRLLPAGAVVIQRLTSAAARTQELTWVLDLNREDFENLTVLVRRAHARAEASTRPQ